MFNNNRKYIKKLNRLVLFISIMFIAITSYCFFLQIINYNLYNDEVKSNIIKYRKLPAPRSDIIDRNGVVIASSVYQNDLYIIPYYFIDSIDLICNNVKLNCNDLAQKIKKYPLNRILIASNIDDRMAINLKLIPGLSVFRYAKRQYHADTFSSHVVGYVGRINRDMLETHNSESLYADNDIVGKTGIEFIYNEHLHGLNGMERYVIMANGLELLSPNRFLTGPSIVKPKKNNEIILSIDTNIQAVFAKEIGDRVGAAVMMDVNSGAVLAMYSSPEFNPENVRNSFNNENHPLVNRALSGYAPGSTFKLITALAALELGIITTDTLFDCSGYYFYGGRIWHCWKHGKLGPGHGKIKLRDAIKRSCDVFFYNLSQKVGLKNIIKYAEMLGFNQYSGIDIDGDNKGSIVGKIIYGGSTINTVIGQGEVLVTMLQLANAYATIINGGTLRSPKINSANIPIILKENNFNKDNIKILMDAMWAVINEDGGTSFYSKLPGLEVAGKTGSAQRISLGKNGKKDSGLFVGYYPVNNPQVVIAITIEGSEHGSLISPIAFKAFEVYKKYY